MPCTGLTTSLPCKQPTVQLVKKEKAKEDTLPNCNNDIEFLSIAFTNWLPIVVYGVPLGILNGG